MAVNSELRCVRVCFEQPVSVLRALFDVVRHL
jgi:hypothetical protein